jgi:hypothetical protein
MTMLSFRVDDSDADQVQVCATWGDKPLDEGERSLAAIADWGPTEDWSDWADATR